MKTLSQYLSETGIRKAQMARLIGASRGYVTELTSGSKRPGLDMAARIERATGGAVPATSWVPPENTSSNARDAATQHAAGQHALSGSKQHKPKETAE